MRGGSNGGFQKYLYCFHFVNQNKKLPYFGCPEKHYRDGSGGQQQTDIDASSYIARQMNDDLVTMALRPGSISHTVSVTICTYLRTNRVDRETYGMPGEEKLHSYAELKVIHRIIAGFVRCTFTSSVVYTIKLQYLPSVQCANIWTSMKKIFQNIYFWDLGPPTSFGVVILISCVTLATKLNISLTYVLCLKATVGLIK